jgi:hypothetical protein
MPKHQVADSAEPKTRELHYVEIVFVCDRCHRERHRVYLRKGKWYCLTCLREVIKQDGGSREAVWRAAWTAEDARDTGGPQRIDRQSPALRPTDSHL